MSETSFRVIDQVLKITVYDIFVAILSCSRFSSLTTVFAVGQFFEEHFCMSLSNDLSPWSMLSWKETFFQ